MGYIAFDLKGIGLEDMVWI